MSYSIPHKLVMLEWEDAAYTNGFNSHGLVTMFTLGFLVHQDKDYSAIAQEYCKDDKDYRHTVSVPNCNIKNITYLRKGKV